VTVTVLGIPGVEMHDHGFGFKTPQYNRSFYPGTDGGLPDLKIPGRHTAAVGHHHMFILPGQFPVIGLDVKFNPGLQLFGKLDLHGRRSLSPFNKIAQLPTHHGRAFCGMHYQPPHPGQRFYLQTKFPLQQIQLSFMGALKQLHGCPHCRYGQTHPVTALKYIRFPFAPAPERRPGRWARHRLWLPAIKSSLPALGLVDIFLQGGKHYE